MSGYVPLHCHSSFSFHAGVPSVSELVARCKELGMTAAALTDTDRVSGLILFYTECLRQGVKPILGVELTDPGPVGQRVDGAGVTAKPRVLVLARNADGYGDLCQLTTRRHVEAARFRLSEELARPLPNLILITADPSMLGTLASGANRERLYGELVHHCERTRRRSAKGIFYIESPAQRRLNQKSQAETFEEITITSSLVRPAGSQYTQLFVERERKRKQGVRDWDFVHPSLEPILSQTHDVCAFQEDVTRICHDVAGLSFKQADKIRKMMNSHHEGAPTDDVWADTARAFLGGCMSHSGLSPEQATELWERVSSFTGFSFCKSHSATYAQLSFQCTYLKAHYPAQFLAAVISNGHGFYRRDVYLNEARRWGITVLPLDVNESAVRYRGRGRYMRPGLMHVRGLRSRILERLVDERVANGPFAGLSDFCQRLRPRNGADGIHRAEVERLILVGAFDRFDLTQPQSLFLLDDLIGHGEADMDLFAAAGTGLTPSYAPIDSVNYSLAERCLRELELLGYMLSGDILEILRLHLGARDTVAARDLGDHAGKGRVKLFGRQVTERMHRVQRSGDPMMFLTIEDRTESADVILWPDVFDCFADVTAEPGPFEVWGRVTEDWGTYYLEADSIRCVDWEPNQVDLELASRHLERSFSAREFVYADIETAAA